MGDNNGRFEVGGRSFVSTLDDIEPPSVSMFSRHDSGCRLPEVTNCLFSLSFFLRCTRVIRVLLSWTLRGRQVLHRCQFLCGHETPRGDYLCLFGMSHCSFIFIQSGLLVVRSDVKQVAES